MINPPITWRLIALFWYNSFNSSCLFSTRSLAVIGAMIWVIALLGTAITVAIKIATAYNAFWLISLYCGIITLSKSTSMTATPPDTIMNKE